MKITRNTILSAIIRQSHLFPNCNVRRKENVLIIELFDVKGKKLLLEANVEEMPLNIATYYGVAEFLEKHPEIKLKNEEIKRTFIEV
jgi:hypothetical protein